MPSSLNQTLDKELAARGGVTRGLGPFLLKAYGESDLRGELGERFEAAVSAGTWDDAVSALQLDAACGGLLPKRMLSEAIVHAQLAPWLVRAVSMRSDAGALLEAMASRSRACMPFIALVARRAKHRQELLADLSDAERVAFAAPLGALLSQPRATRRAKPRSDRKIGRNDPCPCGSTKKFKKCHANDEEFLAGLEASDLDDAPGFPGISAAEMFWFRHADDAMLADLCKGRLSVAGPRAGETLFWPFDDAPADEIAVRAQVAAVEQPEQLPALLARGLETRTVSAEQAMVQVYTAHPIEDWATRPPVQLYRRLSARSAGALNVVGAVTASQVLLLADDERVRSEWLETALAAVGRGKLGPGLDLCGALGQAGRGAEAFLLLHFCRSAGHDLSLPQLQELRALDGALAPKLGNPTLSEGDWLRRDDRTAELARLRSELHRSEAARGELEAQLNRSESLRKRAEDAWAARSVGSENDDALKREVKRLKGLLTREHDKRRDVERNLETIKRRERARLLRESNLDEEKDEASAPTPDPKAAEQAPAHARHVRFHPDFETVAQRLPPSTVGRLRGQVEDLAAGRWVREAKRMEGVGNLWTLRAGIHYRAMIREHDDHLEVFALIPREELDSTLARLRS